MSEHQLRNGRRLKLSGVIQHGQWHFEARAPKP